MNAKPLNIRTAFELLHGFPPETCAHCFKPRHREPCAEQVKYERAMNSDDIDQQRRTEDREAARQEDREFNACESATDWETS